MGLATGFFQTDMFYTPLLEWEAEALAGTCVACGLHLTRDLLIPIFVFQGRDGQWAIYAPVIASPEEVQSWISADTTIANFYLMEAGTGVVRQIRQIGLDSKFMAMMKAALGYVPHPADPEAYGQLLDEIGPTGLWEGARKWVWDARTRAFRPV